MGQFLSVAVAIGVPVAGGFGIGLAIKDDVKGWYQRLDKPAWNPPNWLFGPVWTALYTAMGYASYLVWKETRNGGGLLPLSLYGVHLVMNLAWSPICFRGHQLGWALLDITAMLGVLGATIVEFNKVSPTAAYLLLPTLAWSSFATALTADLYKRNPTERGQLGGGGKRVGNGSDVLKRAQKATADAADVAQQTAKDVKDDTSAAAGKAV